MLFLRKLRMGNVKYIESVLFKKREDGCYMGFNSDIITKEALKQQLEDCNYELPGGVKLYYNVDGDVMCKFEML